MSFPASTSLATALACAEISACAAAARATPSFASESSCGSAAAWARRGGVGGWRVHPLERKALVLSLGEASLRGAQLVVAIKWRW
ncbi:hypothetical protein AB1Y20_006056 [Prymnesium parvum]|uniref:Secreted protein n=1 Tax=Prymnesium parvum TaxID=97485 RepID=A0AB34J1G6_PRYPA